MKSSLTGTEVRSLRSAIGVTQCELAMLMGVSARTISRWETGDGGVSESAARLMNLLASAATEGVSL